MGFGVLKLLFVVCLCAFAVSCSENSGFVPFPRPDGNFALKYAVETAEIVPRYSGSPGAEKTAALIAAAAKSLPGFRVFVDEFRDMTPEGEKVFHNVIAELPGKSEDFLVIGAHYDTKKLTSVPRFAGANDSGSGVGALLAMMKAASETKRLLPLTLKFVFFDGEEALIDYSENDGFHGSRRYVAELKRNKLLRKCRAMILLDMVGDRDLCLKLPADTDLALQDMVLRSARELGFSDYVGSDGPVMLDDHTAFVKAGIPAVDLIDFQYGPDNLYWHTEADTLDKISAESLGISAAIALKTIWKLMKLEH